MSKLRALITPRFKRGDTTVADVILRNMDGTPFVGGESEENETSGIDSGVVTTQVIPMPVDNEPIHVDFADGQVALFILTEDLSLTFEYRLGQKGTLYFYSISESDLEVTYSILGADAVATVPASGIVVIDLVCLDAGGQLIWLQTSDKDPEKNVIAPSGSAVVGRVNAVLEIGTGNPTTMIAGAPGWTFNFDSAQLTPPDGDTVGEWVVLMPGILADVQPNGSFFTTAWYEVVDGSLTTVPGPATFTFVAFKSEGVSDN